MTRRHLLALPALLPAFLLAACIGPPGASRGVDYGDGPRPDPIGDPGKVAAAEIAFAKAAREDGQWTAFRRYAAGDAIIHGQDGPVPADRWLSQLEDPPEAVEWEPKAVWSSCDGSVAVSFGRFEEPGGLVGSFVTVWELQDDRKYLWSYDMGAPDNPQPPPPPPEQEVEEGAIVVSAYDSVRGRVADCDKPADAAPPAPAALPEGVEHATRRSNDGTLQWRWEQYPDGDRRFVADYLRRGRWQQALEFDAPAE